MALHWKWDEKIGEANLIGVDGAEFTLSLYEGNALLIMLHENGECWNMYSFWADKDHMMNCLGLSKSCNGDGNMYDRDGQRITKITINPDKSHNWKVFLPAMVRAWDHLDIEIRKGMRTWLN